MIGAIHTETEVAEFRQRIAPDPVLGPLLGSRLTLFANHPGAAWSFYLTENGALALRGGTGFLCSPPGPLPEAEELALMLHFVGVRRLLTRGLGPQNWKTAQPLFRFAASAKTPAHCPAERPMPARVILQRQPSMWQVAQLLYPEKKAQAEREAFYSESCIALAHGMGMAWALAENDGAVSGEPYRPQSVYAAGAAPSNTSQTRLISTVGCYSVSAGFAYLSGGYTQPEWRGKGLGGWLISSITRELMEQGNTVSLLCERGRRAFYQRMGLNEYEKYYIYIQNG